MRGGNVCGWALGGRPCGSMAALRRALVASFSTTGPEDVIGLSRWAAGLAKTAEVLAVAGKTEGNGCVNDFSRGFATAAVRSALGDQTISIMSGGTEGVLSPHVLAFATEAVSSGEAGSRAPGGETARLTLGTARTRTLAPWEIGTAAQAHAVRDAVLEGCEAVGMNPAALAFVQVKCPLLTSERIAASRAASKTLVTEDCYHSMAVSRGASSLGIALATDEITEVHDHDVCSDYDKMSVIASASAGVELMHCELLLVGNVAGAPSALKAGHCYMKDAVDARAIIQMLTKNGLEVEDGQLTDSGRERLVCMLAKSDPAPEVRGRRTTMMTDSDFNCTRHSRAAVGGLLAGITGDPRVFVSGGAEHQGPPGGGPVCIIYEAE